MRVPGRAWLQFEVTPEKGGSLIRQTALFDPVGLGGLVYWYALWGIHQLVFAGMLRGIARAAAAPRNQPVASPPNVQDGNAAPPLPSPDRRHP
jgi:hypothetical protein